MKINRAYILLAILAIFIFIGLASACQSTLANARTELAKGGFALWYPAEAGIRAGQIWQIKGQFKDIICDRPSGLPVWGPHLVTFESLKKSVNADISLDSNFAAGLLSDARAFNVELKKSTVTSVSLGFGETKVERLFLGDLENEEILAKLPDGYKKCLQAVAAGTGNYILLGAVLDTAGMKYVFTCEDANILAANASKIASVVGIKFDVKIVSKKEAVWEIPAASRLAIGIRPVTDGMLTMTSAQNQRALSPVLLNKTLLPSEFITALEAQIKVVMDIEKKSEGIKR